MVEKSRAANFMEKPLPNQPLITSGRGYPMQHLLFKISGLTDENSVRTLANAIQDLPSIGQVEISLEKGEASIDHGRFVSPDDILQAIVDAGFEAECRY
ncbi:heavy-metal-associated domain-containing protein [Dechloromonas sp. A34]|uniref:heavy-metal-associated domain-containing protein n=1 Tax=Dechloromonas sp. A34 TaxID=447588 RepID=UPI00224998F2|nr:heavy metal-associated domain-containing protein [Dechloromonas sp. A34]